MADASPLTMRGMARGSTRTDLSASAHDQARNFFGLKCVSVEMLEAVQVAPGLFRADFRAREHHRVENPSYGPKRCSDCGREAYPHQSAIPTADWKERP